MLNTADGALSLTERAQTITFLGYPVFPCDVNKHPCHEGWQAEASTDPDKVTRAFADPRAAFIGVPTGEASGIDILDVDPRNGGNDWLAVNADRLPATEIHATRSGGQHFVLNHHPGMRNSAGKLARGVDIRGDGGFAIWWNAHGLYAEYAPVADWPAWALAAEAASRAKPLPPAATLDIDPESIDADGVAAMMRGIEARLNDAEEGAKHSTLCRESVLLGGVLYATDMNAEEAADWLVSALPATVLDHSGAINTALSGLAKGAQHPIPMLDAAAEFGAVTIPPECPAPAAATVAKIEAARAALVEPKPGTITARPYRFRDPSEIPPRAWLYAKHYIRQFISATFAPGGLGKSSLAIAEAVDMATGKGLLTGKPTREQFRVWYHCGEDPLVEIERRVAAVCKHYRIQRWDIEGRLFITSGRDCPIIIATETSGGAYVAKPVVEAVLLEMIEKSIDVLILDPFVSTHAVSENANGSINEVARTWAGIADTANASVELVHHVRKQTGQTVGQDRTAADGRGAGALVDAARSVRVLNTMAAEEGDALGIPAEQRRLYFRVDSGKANLVPPSDSATWRHLASVDLENGNDRQPSDFVGVVESWERPEVDAGITDAHAAELRRRLAEGAPNRRDMRSPEWCGHALADILGLDSGERATRRRVQGIIERFIGAGVLRAVAGKNGRNLPVDCVAPGPNATAVAQLHSRA